MDMHRGVRFYDDNGIIDFHTRRDMEITMTKKVINLPDAKVNVIDVPGRDGSLDLTAAIGRTRYKNRTLVFNFVYADAKSMAAERMLQKLGSYIQGKKMNIVEDDDPTHYYIGRCSISSISTEPYVTKFHITCDCEPYRYDIYNNGLWEWDSFDFENDIATDYEDITFNGSIDVLVVAGDKIVFPEFICSDAMTVECNGNIYQLNKGNNTPELILIPGVNTLIFRKNGMGVVNIRYRGGYL